MRRSKVNVSGDVFLIKHPVFLLVLIFIILFGPMGCEARAELEYEPQQEEEEYVDSTIAIQYGMDPTVSLLGKSFIEISQELGEPDEKGYSEILGPHNFILYRYDEGFMRFASPESLENDIAVSIIVGPGQEVLGAKVGMYFPEIISVLGPPDFGPEQGLDDLYYMDYFWGSISDDQIPEFYIGFVAVSMDSPTDQAFIKWENFQMDEIVLLAAK